jgi:hypothetical protein
MIGCIVLSIIKVTSYNFSCVIILYYILYYIILYIIYVDLESNVSSFQVTLNSIQRFTSTYVQENVRNFNSSFNFVDDN